MRRAESCKIDSLDQMPDWSCSYRQANSGQLSEIAEAHSDDAFKGTTFVEVINKSNPFEMNYYSSSTRSRLARRQISKELTETKNAEHVMNKFVDQYQINELTQPKAQPMSKALSSVKPILPPLNIGRVRDENQNVLAIKNFHEATRNKSSRSPHLSAGLSRVGAIGDINLSIGEGDGSFIKGDTSRRDDISNTQKLRNLARRLGESYFTKDLPALTKLLRSEKDYESLSNTKGFENFTFKKSRTNSISKREKSSLNSKSCSCQLEAKFLLMKKINLTKEDSKSKGDLIEHSHNKILDTYIDDKMRLLLLNLLNLFIEKFEITEYEGFFNTHNTSSHPVNLFYCHLSSNEIYAKLKNTQEYINNYNQIDLINDLFDSDMKFCIDFDGTIHYSKGKNVSEVTDISNASYLEHLIQGDLWKLQENSFDRNNQELNDSGILSLLENNMIFNTSFNSERVTIFKIFSKIAV